MGTKISAKRNAVNLQSYSEKIMNWSFWLLNCQNLFDRFCLDFASSSW